MKIKSRFGLWHSAIALMLLSANVGGVLAQRAELRFSAGLQIPMQWEGGMEYRFSQHAALCANLGIVSAPWQQAIGGIMRAYGANSTAMKQVETTLQIGLHPELGFRFPIRNGHFLRGNIGLLFTLPARIRMDELGRGLGVDTSLLPVTGQTGLTSSMASIIPTAHVGYGYEWRTPNGKLAIRAEVGVTKMLYNWPFFQSVRTPGEAAFPNEKQLWTASKLPLASLWLRYGWVPTVGITVSFQAWRSKELWCP
jgi:hypothetical protein